MGNINVSCFIIEHNSKVKKYVKVNVIINLDYSRVWNKRTPLNKRSPLENLAKIIIVAPFLPYIMKSGIRP